MNNIIEHCFDHREAMFEALTDKCTHQLTQACETQGKASFLVSGGSTPQPLYQRLSQQLLPWKDVQVALVDERWVPPSHPSSNQTFIAKHLMQNHAQAAQFIPMKTPDATAQLGLETTKLAYQQLNTPFDVTILGMGNDGHTASIFPHCTGIEQALDPQHDQQLAAIMAHPSEVTGDNLERITLTMGGILHSKYLVLLITGETKLTVYRQALVSDDHRSTPISAVLQQTNLPVHLYWAP